MTEEAKRGERVGEPRVSRGEAAIERHCALELPDRLLQAVFRALVPVEASLEVRAVSVGARRQRFVELLCLVRIHRSARRAQEILRYAARESRQVRYARAITLAPRLRAAP